MSFKDSIPIPAGLKARIRLAHEIARQSLGPARPWYLRNRMQTRVERATLQAVRDGRDVCWGGTNAPGEPLVTVTIPTFERPDVIERSVRSAQEQTYERLEILVVGDCTDDVTESIVRRIERTDERVRFINLGRRGLYPRHPKHHWMVAGAAAANAAVALAGGDWIANCDDDDELLPQHVEMQLKFAQEHRLELVHSRWENVWVKQDGSSVRETAGNGRFVRGQVCRGAILYNGCLRFMLYDLDSWRIGEPADWNFWSRMQSAGVRIGFMPEVTYRYYRREMRTDGV